MGDELKLCPFCGGTKTKAYEEENGWWHVSCVGIDGCSARNGNFRSRAEAITAWNTRTETQSQATIDELVGILRDICSEADTLDRVTIPAIDRADALLLARKEDGQ